MVRLSTRPSAHDLRRIVPVALAAAVLMGISPAAGATAAHRRATVDPRLAAAVAAGRPVTALAVLGAQADVSAAERLADKAAKGRLVHRLLVAQAEATQGQVRAVLTRRGLNFTPYFIVNAVAFEADAPTVAAVAALDGVASIVPLVSFGLSEPPAVAPAALRRPPSPGASSLDPPSLDRSSPQDGQRLAVAERNIKAIGADKVWRQGFQGAGVTVAVIDTGVNGRHPALSPRYRGRTEGDDYNWLDAIAGQDAPVDSNDHGTHVAGIVLGKQGSREIGVAPEAQWIACRIFVQDRGTTKAILDCLQWALAPTKRDGSDPRPDKAPDIINASWGIFGRNFCDNPFPAEPAIRNLLAAGILFVAAAGNDGPRCASVCPPASLLSAFTVGNYDDEGRRMADTSSRGPFTQDGVERIKPDIAAPGENINSSVGTSDYGIKQGTSMAAPHVAGAAALVLSARPALRGHPDQLRALLESTADAQNADQCGPSGARAFNNSAGHGVVDVAAAVAAALNLPTATATRPATPTVPVTPSPTASPRPSQAATATDTATATRTPTGLPTAAPTASRTAPATVERTPGVVGRIYLPRGDRGR